MQWKLNDHSPDALDTLLTKLELKNRIYHQLLERRSNEILLVIVRSIIIIIIIIIIFPLFLSLLAYLLKFFLFFSFYCKKVGGLKPPQPLPLRGPCIIAIISFLLVRDEIKDVSTSCGSLFVGGSLKSRVWLKVLGTIQSSKKNFPS